jgi:hypothetical protein
MSIFLKKKIIGIRLKNYYSVKLLLIYLLLFGFFNNQFAENKFMIIIIDGARYTETFGDPNHTYIPKMWNMRTQGTYFTNFYNDSMTYTSRAIPALWCGSWTEVRDTVCNGHNTQYSIKPTIFEYSRKQKSLPADQCFYVLKFITNLWLPSFHANYGPQYWPTYHSQGVSDDDVVNQAQYVLTNFHPHFIWIYLADVDGAGHSGNWPNYVDAIQNADSIVSVLWNFVQSDPFYQNSTYLFITNDHGRHDDQHGGFQGHGNGCEGCRHIMFLALGPEIKQNFVSHQYHRIPDMAVTASDLLNINPEYATGQVMSEMIKSSQIIEDKSNISVEDFSLSQNYPNPFNPRTTIEFSLPKASEVTLTIFNILGEEVATLVSDRLTVGSYSYEWEASQSAGMASGIYFYSVQSGNYVETRKMILMK